MPKEKDSEKVLRDKLRASRQDYRRLQDELRAASQNVTHAPLPPRDNPSLAAHMSSSVRETLFLAFDPGVTPHNWSDCLAYVGNVSASPDTIIRAQRATVEMVKAFRLHQLHRRFEESSNTLITWTVGLDGTPIRISTPHFGTYSVEVLVSENLVEFGDEDVAMYYPCEIHQMSDTSAASMVCAAHVPGINEVPHASGPLLLVVKCDKCPTNTLFFRLLQALCRKDDESLVYGIWAFCLAHCVHNVAKTSLLMEMEMLHLANCLRFHRWSAKNIASSVGKRLRVIYGDPPPEQPSDLFVKRCLEVLWRNFATSKSDRVRREAKDLKNFLDFFPRPGSRPWVHFCCPSCCHSFSESKNKVANLIIKLRFFCPPVIPNLARWLTWEVCAAAMLLPEIAASGVLQDRLREAGDKRSIRHLSSEECIIDLLSSTVHLEWRRRFLFAVLSGDTLQKMVTPSIEIPPPLRALIEGVSEFTQHTALWGFRVWVNAQAQGPRQGSEERLVAMTRVRIARNLCAFYFRIYRPLLGFPYKLATGDPVALQEAAEEWAAAKDCCLDPFFCRPLRRDLLAAEKKKDPDSNRPPLTIILEFVSSDPTELVRLRKVLMESYGIECLHSHVRRDWVQPNASGKLEGISKKHVLRRLRGYTPGSNFFKAGALKRKKRRANLTTLPTQAKRKKKKFTRWWTTGFQEYDRARGRAVPYSQLDGPRRQFWEELARDKNQQTKNQAIVDPGEQEIKRIWPVPVDEVEVFMSQQNSGTWTVDSVNKQRSIANETIPRHTHTDLLDRVYQARIIRDPLYPANICKACCPQYLRDIRQGIIECLQSGGEVAKIRKEQPLAIFFAEGAFHFGSDAIFLEIVHVVLKPEIEMQCFHLQEVGTRTCNRPSKARYMFPEIPDGVTLPFNAMENMATTLSDAVNQCVQEGRGQSGGTGEFSILELHVSDVGSRDMDMSRFDVSFVRDVVFESLDRRAHRQVHLKNEHNKKINNLLGRLNGMGLVLPQPQPPQEASPPENPHEHDFDEEDPINPEVAMYVADMQQGVEENMPAVPEYVKSLLGDSRYNIYRSETHLAYYTLWNLRKHPIHRRRMRTVARQVRAAYPGAPRFCQTKRCPCSGADTYATALRSCVAYAWWHRCWMYGEPPPAEPRLEEFEGAYRPFLPSNSSNRGSAGGGCPSIQHLRHQAQQHEADVAEAAAGELDAPLIHPSNSDEDDSDTSSLDEEDTSDTSIDG